MARLCHKFAGPRRAGRGLETRSKRRPETSEAVSRPTAIELRIVARFFAALVIVIVIVILISFSTKRLRLRLGLRLGKEYRSEVLIQQQ
jgi:hypothetical protein